MRLLGFDPGAVTPDENTIRLFREKLTRAGALDALFAAFDRCYPTLGTRRAIQYSKGALFMDYLRTMLGDAAFWSGLRRYTRTHAGGTVMSIYFERAMEAAGNQDLHQVFADWVFGDATEADRLRFPRSGK